MPHETPVALEYESPQPPPAPRLATHTLVSGLGLVTTVAGLIILVQSAQPEPDDRHQARFGAIIACFGITWWILGLFLKEATRRGVRGAGQGV